MLKMDFLSTIQGFFEPVIRFFVGIWDSIRDFLLQYMPADVINVLVFAVIIVVVLITLLAIINKN